MLLVERIAANDSTLTTVDLAGAGLEKDVVAALASALKVCLRDVCPSFVRSAHFRHPR